jgi:hypothetical protein
MLKVEATINYKIPHNEYCNMPGGELCRFAVPDDIHLRCVLHDEELTALRGAVKKCDACLDCRYTRKCKIEDPVVDLDPKTIIRVTLQEFIRIYRGLRNRRISEGMALEMAREQVRDPNHTL